MSTDPKNWAAEFPRYPDFQRFQAQGAWMTVTVEAKGLNDILMRLADGGEDMQRKVMEVSLELLARIARRTPVKTGRLRNSFHVVPPGSDSDSFDYEDNAGHPFSGNLTEGLPTGPFEALVGTNVLYALSIEAGHSRQAPNGMVAVSVAELRGALEAKLQEAIDHLKAVERG